MENINGNNNVYGVLHCDVAPGGTCDEFTGRAGSRPCPGTACNGNIHKYTFEVDRSQPVEEIRWYVDDVLFWQVTSSQMPSDVWAATVQKPHFVLLNLAIGGAFPNAVYGGATPIGSTTSGGTLRAEYVAVYNS
jgi:beta-glucanase (GH16 family)